MRLNRSPITKIKKNFNPRLSLFKIIQAAVSPIVIQSVDITVILFVLNLSQVCFHTKASRTFILIEQQCFKAINHKKKGLTLISQTLFSVK